MKYYHHNLTFREEVMAIFIAVLLSAIAIILSITIVNIMFPQQEYDCDIGSERIVGDYEISLGFAQGPKYAERCALEDCVAFNKYQERINSDSVCLVRR